MEGRTYGSLRTVFPIPDLHEGRVTTDIIDDLLCQSTDEVIKDSQPISRNIVHAPSRLRLSKEWQKRRPGLRMRFVGGQCPKVYVIIILRPCEWHMFSTTSRDINRLDKPRERKTYSKGARARRTNKSCSGSIVKSRIVMPNAYVQLPLLEPPPGVSSAPFTALASLDPAPSFAEAGGVG